VELAQKSSTALTDLDVSLKSLSGMATDTAQAWHNFLHPKWPTRLKDALLDWGSATFKFFF
jgi:hypothetical protein